MKRLLMNIVAMATIVLLLVPSVAMGVTKKPDNEKTAYTKAELDARFQKIHAIMRKLVEEKSTAEEVLAELAKIDVYPGEDTTIESLKSLKAKSKKDTRVAS